MTKNFEFRNITQLLAEADELTKNINSDVIKDIEEIHRLQLEKHVQNLKQIKSEVQVETDKKRKFKISSGLDGMHEAIMDIVKAMKELKEYYS